MDVLSRVCGSMGPMTASSILSVQWRLVLTLAVLALSACTSLPASDASATATPWERAGLLAESETPVRATGPADAVSLWRHQTFPGKRKNRFQYVWREGRPALAVQSDAAISAMRQVVMTPSERLDGLRFSWRLAGLIEKADLQDSSRSDSPLGVVMTFDGDRSRLSSRDLMLSDLARAVTGEDMPYATLMYVWSNDLPVGSVVVSRRTDRIRKMVIESGAGGLNRWLDYERDVRADFERAFGEAPGRLMSVGLMTDTDNTGASVRAWYGPVSLRWAR